MTKLIFLESIEGVDIEALRAKEQFLCGCDVKFLVPTCSKEELEEAKALLSKNNSENRYPIDEKSISVVALDFEGKVKGFRVAYNGLFYDLTTDQYANCSLKNKISISKKRKLYRDSNSGLLMTKDELESKVTVYGYDDLVKLIKL